MIRHLQVAGTSAHEELCNQSDWLRCQVFLAYARLQMSLQGNQTGSIAAT